MNKHIQLSFNTKPFDYEDMVEYFTKTDRIPELHLHYFIEDGIKVEDTIKTLKPFGITIADGGWYDFTQNKTIKLHKQISTIQSLNIHNLRLFFTPLYFEDMSNKQYKKLVGNIQQLADEFPRINLLFETHKGIGTSSSSVADILYTVKRENVGIVFDPVNILMDGKNPHKMLKKVGLHIKHVHLKGYKKSGILCAFGEGIDISSSIIEAMKYCTSFGIEYEGKGNVIRGLEQSYQNFKVLCGAEGIEV